MADRIGKCVPLGKIPIEWHWVYTVEEAGEEGLEVVNWREAVTGQWALTDDGYVAQVLNHKSYQNARKQVRKYMRFVFCKVFVSHKPLFYMNYKESGIYYKIKPKGDLENGSLKRRYRDFAFMYAHMMVHKGWVNFTKLGKSFNPTAKNPKFNAKQLSKVPKMQQMIRDEVKKALLDNDVTVDSVIKLVIDASNVAKNKKDAANMLKSADMLMDVLQMKSKRNNMLPEHETDAIDALYEVINESRQAVRDTPGALPEPDRSGEGDNTPDVPGPERSLPP